MVSEAGISHRPTRTLMLPASRLRVAIDSLIFNFRLVADVGSHGVIAE